MAQAAAERYFLHYTPHSDFERGIFMPFATPQEAEMQAAADLAGGTDPDFIRGIFREQYQVPKFGWTPDQVYGQAQDEMLHLRTRKASEYEARIRDIIRAAPKYQRQIAEAAASAARDEILAIHAAVQEGRGDFRNAVPGNAYSWNTGGTATAGAIALAAATAKTLVLIQASTANQPSLVEVGISFDGVTASAVPILVELISGTATTGGTPRAALVAGKQLRGWPAQPSQTTCADGYTAEPTVQLVNRKWLVTPNGGLFVVQFPLGREPTGLVTATTDGKTWSLRATAPAIVNAHAYIEFEE